MEAIPKKVVDAGCQNTYMDTTRERKSMKQKILQAMFAVLLIVNANAQVNSGSNGSDGALDFSSINYTTNIVINMADHPTGIYQYTYVNIPNGVTVTFTPNANNTPVYWLVQSNCTISGTVSVAGTGMNSTIGGLGGPGGWGGGSGGGSGLGPGGGGACALNNGAGGSFGSQGYSPGGCSVAGPVYGNSYLLPLIGGSGGGSGYSPYPWNYYFGGGGGGGAILIAASISIQLNGIIDASGGYGAWTDIGTGSSGGSGGGVRLVTANFSGTGSIKASGGRSYYGGAGGDGRVRIDAYQSTFGGSLSGVVAQGSQFVIIPSAGQLPQLTIMSVGGVTVSASPSGQIVTPDAVLSAQQNNPIPVVVSCANLPLNSLITVSITPANGSPVSATGYNTTGTLASSTATISIVIPRGGGLIYATAATGN
jgi:hypothetical protein